MTIPRTVIDPGNPFVATGHVRCAAQEMPFLESEAPVYGPHTGTVLNVLEENLKLKRISDRWYNATSELPQHEVSLRGYADENVVIPAFANLLEKLPDALLILVPRYPERFARAAQSAKDAGLRTELHSEGEACSTDAQCFVIDTIGELMTYYA